MCCTVGISEMQKVMEAYNENKKEGQRSAQA